jgi:tetratricopeptide (TPR) repeat protein
MANTKLLKNRKLTPLKAENKKRQLIFKIISISFPFVLLLFFEIILRIFNYGFTYSLFIKDTKLQGFYTMNPDIVRRYFVNLKEVLSVTNESFRKEKAFNSYRIFVLGESSAMGYPYMHNGSFHRMLKYRLDRTYPDKNIEIINLAITAINSYTLLDFTDEVLQMNPDAILIYTGHNEYYGALGVSSNQRLGFSRGIVKTTINLKKFKVVQLAFNTSKKVKEIFSPKVAEGNIGLMQQMAEKQEVVFGSKIFNLGLKQFEENMDELVQKYNQKQIPVYFSNIVSNERGQKPFINKLNSTTDTVRFMKEYRSGLEAYNKNDFDTALDRLLNANKIDTSYAINNFLIGEILYAKGDFVNACRYYFNAKELDALRFRAPEAINAIINKLSNKYKNVYFVDVKKEFIANSDHGILDNKLFTEHLHPTLPGYFIISDAFYNSLIDTKMFGIWDHIIPADSIQKELPVTAIDSIIGKLEILKLRERWPFYEHIDYTKVITHTYPEDLVGDIYLRKKKWADAMYDLQKYYLKNGNKYEALRVAKGLELQFPHEWIVPYTVASSCLELKQYSESFFYFRKAFVLAPYSKIAQEIVINLLQLNKLEEAKKYLEFMIQNDPSNMASRQIFVMIGEVLVLKKLLVSETKNIAALNSLAYFYLTIKKPEEAKLYIDKALSVNAKDTQLLKLLNVYNKLIKE